MKKKTYFTWKPEAPLEHHSGETQRASQALWDYAHMGPGRSLGKLLMLYRGQSGGRPRVAPKPPTKRLATLEGWSSRYHWQDRVACWEQIQKENEAAEWEERRAEFREEAYRLARLALTQLKIMLTLPLTKRTLIEEGEDGEPDVIVIEPVRWNMGHVATLLATAYRVGSLALGEPTERTEHKHSGQMEVHDFSYLPDEELNDLLQELLEKLAGPGPEDLKAPDFTWRPPGNASGNGTERDGDGH